MNEYKKLLVLLSAIETLENIMIPMNIIKENIIPLKDYAERRIKEIEVVKNEN